MQAISSTFLGVNTPNLNKRCSAVAGNIQSKLESQWLVRTYAYPAKNKRLIRNDALITLR